MRAVRARLGQVLDQHQSAGPHALMEDNAALMLSLLRMAGCSMAGGEASIGGASTTLKRGLTESLTRTLYYSVDGAAFLDGEAGSPQDLFYDGAAATLRNANGLSLKEAGDRVDALIAKALRDHPFQARLAPWPRQLRLALLADPTLALHPLPDSIRYGSRQWAMLRVGMEAAAELGIDMLAFGIEDLLALGRAAMMESGARQAGEPAAAAIDTTSFRALRHMAAAAGALSGIAAADTEAIGDAVRSFANREFQHEIRLHEALTRTAVADMPTRKGVAAELLKAHGIDPERRIKGNYALVPATIPVTALTPAGGLTAAPVVLDVPILPASTERSIAEEYFERDALSIHHLAQLFSSPVGTKGTPDAAQAMPMARAMDDWLAKVARQAGTDLSQAAIAIHRVTTTAESAERGQLVSAERGKHGDASLANLDVPGLFLSLSLRGEKRIVHFPGPGLPAEDLPAETTMETWCLERAEPVLNDRARTRHPGLRGRLLYTAQAHEIISGRRAELPRGRIGVTIEGERLLAQLPPSLRDEFDKRFDHYRDAMAGPVTAVLDAWLSILAKRRDIDLTKAHITIGRGEIDVHRPSGRSGVKLGLQPYGPAVFGKHRLPGYFISIHTGAEQETWYLPFDAGNAVRLPSGGSIQDWVRAQKDQIFPAALMRKLRDSVPGTLDHRVAVHEVARGRRDQATQWLPPGIRDDIDRNRDEARDMTTREKASEFVLNLVPFRAAYVAFQQGDIAEGIREVLIDGLSFLPAIHQSVKLARAMTRAGSQVFRQAARSLASGTGVRQAVISGASRASSLAPDIGRLAANVALLGLDGVLPIPLPLGHRAALGSARTSARSSARILGIADGVGHASPAIAAALRQAAKDMQAMQAHRPQRVAADAAAGIALPGGLGPSQAAAYRVQRPADAARMPGMPETVHLAAHGSERYIDIRSGTNTYSFLVEGDTRRGWHIVPPDKPGPKIPVAFRDGEWRIADAAGLPGGAPIQRALADPADIQHLDSGVPMPYARTTPGGDPPRLGTGAKGERNVSRTRTVIDTARIVGASRDITPYPGHIEKLDQMIQVDYLPWELEHSALLWSGRLASKKADIRRNTLAFYRKLYDESPTFRGIFNLAVQEGRIGVNAPWKVALHPPLTLRLDGLATYAPGIPFAWYASQRKMDLPPLHMPAADYPHYLTSDGTMHVTPAHAHVHTMVHALTGHPDPDIAAWYQRRSATPTDPGTSSQASRAVPERGRAELDMDMVRRRGLGERGAVDYLSQRILEEIGEQPPRRLSMVALTDAREGVRLAAQVPTALGLLTSYVELQNRYLDALIPRIASDAPSAAGTRIDPPRRADTSPAWMHELDRTDLIDIGDRSGSSAGTPTGAYGDLPLRPATPVTPLDRVPGTPWPGSTSRD